MTVSFFLFFITVVVGNYVTIESFYKGPETGGSECLSVACAEVGGRTEAEIDACLESVPASCWYVSHQLIEREWTEGCFNEYIAIGSTKGLLGLDFSDMKLHGGGKAVEFLEYKWTITDNSATIRALPQRCSYLAYKFPPEPDTEHLCNLPTFHNPGRPVPAGSVPVMTNTLHVSQAAALHLLNQKGTSQDWVWFSDTQLASDDRKCLTKVDSAQFYALVKANHTGRAPSSRRSNQAVFVPSIAAVSLSAIFMGK